MATCRTFVRGKEKYSLSDKKELGELISNHKEKYDKERRKERQDMATNEKNMYQ